MKQSHFLNSLTYAFLALFLATKLIGLHVLTHHDDSESYLDDCAICHNIASDTHAPGILSDDFEAISERIEIAFQKEIDSEYSFVALGMLNTSFLFSRPPPNI
ncbi:hypothetical protein PY092_15680 [Muricauda sp. 334s03]|uniref:Cytochrome c domain-containing protein n=1 Tax=Flagellimonas yonaguniensis TaxID=3031325 RepID=A0ABT5Y2D2_9FLAO|nr:hypothetical protein [[Muricauda] yonaguniensis]MDF0717604.1 hypothetical protein [[Muricauda] yonaguniensis]